MGCGESSLLRLQGHLQASDPSFILRKRNGRGVPTSTSRPMTLTHGPWHPHVRLWAKEIAAKGQGLHNPVKARQGSKLPVLLWQDRRGGGGPLDTVDWLDWHTQHRTRKHYLKIRYKTRVVL